MPGLAPALPEKLEKLSIKKLFAPEFIGLEA
jgi:hypothetical protein